MIGHVLLNHKRQCSTNVTRQLVELTPHSRVTCGIHLTN